MINCIIIEDELLARQKLELYVKKHENLNLVRSFVSGEDFLIHADNIAYELLLLDIGLPNIDGITLAAKLPKNCKVIFTTAYTEHAVEAFNLNAADYLLKPFDYERFSMAILKVVRRPTEQDDSGVKSKTILVKEGKKIHRLSVDDILYIEGLREYVVWHTLSGQLVTRHSLSHLNEYLEAFNFIQTHKSYIVNVEKMSLLEYGFIHVMKHQIPIGRKYRDLVKERFKRDL